MRNKLDPKSRKCIFLGYGISGEMGFHLWDPEARKIIRSHDVVFNEEKMHKKPMPTVEVRRVVIQEDGIVHNRVVNPPIIGQQAQDVHAENPPIENHDGAKWWHY